MQNRSKFRLRAAAVGLLLLSLGACKSDGEGIFASLSSLGLGNNPPTIAGTPKTTVQAGHSYVFRPTAADPDGNPLTFSIRNKPRWATFNADNGRLAGTPSASDAGVVAGIEIIVSDGNSTGAIGPFDIRVDGDTSGAGPTPVDPAPTVPSTVPSSPASFHFSAIPEIVFVRGYADREHMGIFHVDTQNRWTPGDLENAAHWKPRVATEIRVESGTLSGVSYDPETGVLTYDGSGRGTETATVVLTAPREGATSDRFNVRVLQPTIAWGDRAASRFPGIGFDSTETPWIEMQRRMVAGAPYESPNVLLVAGGTYSDDFYTGKGLRTLYIIGEPGRRPLFRGDNINLDDLETAYLKNLELQNTTINGGAVLEESDVDFYFTGIYQHDSERDENGIKAPPASPDPGRKWRYWLWNFHGAQMGWQSNLRHQFYIEGRRDSHLFVNNIRIDGTRRCSAIKSTRSFIDIRNSYVSAVQDPDNLARGLRSDKLLDVASAAEIVIYNNELVGVFSNARWGVANGLIFLRARRNMWGADSPAYPDISWTPPVSSTRDSTAPEGFTAGPETFVNPRFWEMVRSFDVGDPGNPYTFKKFVSHNRFRWIDEEGKRQSVFRDDGTAPREAEYQGSTKEVWGTIPPGWVERSVSFLANNAYEGWTREDTRESRSWFDVDNHPGPTMVTKMGAGPWAYPPPPRPVVVVGGEVRPDGAQPAVALPGWFKH